MLHHKPAHADHEIHTLLRNRWSPRAFTPAPVETAALLRLLEAARWAPSSNNEQPWSFIVARKEQPEEFQKALSCLMDFNQAWVQHAALILFAVAKKVFTKDGHPNAYAFHDVGLAVAQFTLQATHEGLGVHQLGGVHHEQIRSTYGLPEDWQAVTGLAVGYPGSPDQLPDALKQRELAARHRKPLSEFVFTGTWGQQASFLPGK